MTKTSVKSDGMAAKKEKVVAFKPPFYESFRLQKHIKTDPGLPSSFVLIKDTLLLIRHNSKLFAGIVGIYGALLVLFVQGLTTIRGLEETKQMLQATIGGGFVDLVAGLSLYVQLLGSPASLGSTANLYQFMVTLFGSLALIWAWRQAYAKNTVRVRDAFYRGMYPLIPFLLVLGMALLQLLPFALGGTVFATVVRNGIAATGIEILLWGIGFFVLAITSLYLITPTLLALYIVTLPDMGPLQAIRSAKELVRGRHWIVLRKILFLPFGIVVGVGIVMIPLLMFVPPLVGWTFFLLTLCSFVIAHGYMYRLYRALI